jgi:hypothetical protein
MKAKLGTRRYINDCEATNVTRNILTALGDQPYKIKTTSGEVGHDTFDAEPSAALVRTNSQLFERMPTKDAADRLLAA